MGMTTINSRTFNQDASGAKREALEGPVFITDVSFEPDRLRDLTRPADLS